MTRNYHTHTFRCHHAAGTEKEYVEEALKNSLTLLGFSDHSPYIFPGDYYSKFRMFPEQTADYYRTLGLLREEYQGRLDIRIGFEMEYYPKQFRQTLEFMAEQEQTLPSGEKAGLQYLILGQHFIGNEYDSHEYSGMPTESDTFLGRYVENVMGGLETGCFSCIAHPDLVNYTGSKRVYKKHMRELCECAKAHSVPVEINLLGLHTKRNYPNPLFWDIVKETGNEVILGCDAHTVHDAGSPELIREGEDFAARWGFPLIDELRLIDPLSYLK